MSSPKIKLTSLSTLFSNLQCELSPINGESRVGVDNCVNRILARDVFAKYDNPPFDNSAIDGYALNEDIVKTGKKFSLIEGLVRPGDVSDIVLKKNEGIKILTGAPIPKGTSRIIFKENTKQQDHKIYFDQDDVEENNIRLKGEDFKKGDLLFNEGTQIKITDLATLIGSGNSSVAVSRSLKVGLITTGNELSEKLEKQDRKSVV